MASQPPLSAPSQPADPQTPSKTRVASIATSRPSYASPTRASIAKHNPAILRRIPSKGEDRDDRIAKRISQSFTATRGNDNIALQNDDTEEPQLPPTPVQRGLDDPIVTTPPSGIHNTPSKRLKRTHTGEPKSSPLKPREGPPQLSTQNSAITIPTDVDESFAGSRESNIPTRILDAGNDLTIAYPQRRTDAIDPLQQQKHIRDQLQKELDQLELDVKYAEEQNQRLATSTPTSLTHDDILTDDRLSQILLRDNSTVIALPDIPTQPSILVSTNRFLPFASRRRRSERPVYPINTQTRSDSIDIAIDVSPFSTLKYTSKVTMLTKPADLGTTSTRPSLLHNITASHPNGLFSALIRMTVDTSDNTISSLTIPSMSPDAEHELGRWFKSRNDVGSSRDINTLCFAMNEWIDLASIRAKAWLEIEAFIANTEERQEMLSRVSKRSKQKDQIVEVVEKSEPVRQKWSRRQIMANLGRQHLQISHPTVPIRLNITWKLNFDYLGEVESEIDAWVDIPTSWRKEDERNGFNKVSHIFKELVRRSEIVTATKSIATLLLPI